MLPKEPISLKMDVHMKDRMYERAINSNQHERKDEHLWLSGQCMKLYKLSGPCDSSRQPMTYKLKGEHVSFEVLNHNF